MVRHGEGVPRMAQVAAHTNAAEVKVREAAQRPSHFRTSGAGFCTTPARAWANRKPHVAQAHLARVVAQALDGRVASREFRAYASDDLVVAQRRLLHQQLLAGGADRSLPIFSRLLALRRELELRAV